MKMESALSYSRSTGRRIGASLAALSILAACANTPKTTESEAHFSVACPSGGIPAITKVAHSGELPVDPEGKKLAEAVIRLACAGGGQDPVIKQDMTGGGKCLGYGNESHLRIEAAQPGEEGPDFFVAKFPAIGVTGSSDLTIRTAELHYHISANPCVS